MKVWVFDGFTNQKLEKPGLGDHHDVRKPRAKPAKVERLEGAVAGLNGWAVYPGMPQMVERFGESDLIENLQDGRMDRITSEIAIKVLMRLQQRYVDAAAGEQ